MTGKKRVIAYLHTHWDREWYRTKEEFNLRLLEVFDEVLDELSNKPENKAGSASIPCFYFDGATAALEDYLKFRPENRAIVEKFVKEKKLFIGPFYVSPDNFLVNGISLVRNLSLGIQYAESFGESGFLGYLADTFGHSKSIFKIFKAFDIGYCLAWRGIGAVSHNDFLMNGIKTTKLVMGYFMDALHNLSYCKACKDWVSGATNTVNPYDSEVLTCIKVLENILDRIAQKSSDTLLLPVGADHLAVLANGAKVVEFANKFLENYEIALSSPFEYVESVDYSGLSMDGEFLDNSETYILPGVYSSRIAQKVDNAVLQWNLFRKTEPFNYFLSTLSEDLKKKCLKYRPSLDYAAKELIKNHAHDSIYGCSVDEVHKTVQARFDKAKAVCDGVEHRLVRDFSRKFAQKPCVKQGLGARDVSKNLNPGVPFGVFNFSNFEYSGTVSIIAGFRMKNAQVARKFRGFSDEILYDTRLIPVTEDYLPLFENLIEVKALPPLSFTSLNSVKPLLLPVISEDKISNGRLELNLERRGGKILINLLDKKKNIEYKDALKILVTRDIGDSYNFAPASEPAEYKLLRSKVIEKGPVRAVLRLIFENNFKLDVSLTGCSEFFEFRAKFNNRKKNIKIQACFNLKNPIDTTFAEDAFGFIERKHDYKRFLYDELPAKPRLELNTNSYPMQKCVIARGFGVMTIGLNEYEIYKNELKIALLRGTGRISEPHNPARYVPAGPPIETPDLQALGAHDLRFACALNTDTKDILRLTEALYRPAVAILGDFSKFGNKNFLDLPENLIFYGLKPSDSKDIGVFYNTGTSDITYKNTVVPPETIAFIEL